MSYQHQFLQSFSPLHSGQATAIFKSQAEKIFVFRFQSPPFGASHCNVTVKAGVTSIDNFQSPPFGASHCNQVRRKRAMLPYSTFSPLHSGQATAIQEL